MIDLQSVRGGEEGDYRQRFTEIKAEWEAAGIIVLDLGTQLPESVMGVPIEAIGGRLRGGGPGEQQLAVQIFTDLWPLVAAGFVGAMSTDAWNYTKKRLASALKRLLGKKADKITIQVADAGDGLQDDTYEFDTQLMSDVDAAVEAMVRNVLARGAIQERRTVEYRWDARDSAWIPVRRVDTRTSLSEPGERDFGGVNDPE